MGYYDNEVLETDVVSNNSICRTLTTQPKSEYGSMLTALWQNVCGCVVLLLLFAVFYTSIGSKLRTVWRSTRCKTKWRTLAQFCNLHYLQQIDKESMDACYGEDATLYLSLQRYIIAILVINCMVCTFVLIPVNYYWGHLQDLRQFKSLSLFNIDPEESYIWIHIFIGFAQMPIAMIFMRKYADNVLSKCQYMSTSEKSLELVGVPRDLRTRQGIKDWILDKYPWVEIENVYLTFKMGRLWSLNKKRETLRGILNEVKSQDTLFCSKNSNAREFYSKKLEDLEEKIRHEQIVCLAKPLDTLFVVFKNKSDAKSILEFENTDGIQTKDFVTSSAPIMEGKSLQIIGLNEHYFL